MEAGAWSAVVTGVGAGIGRAIFERLLADGWSVVGLELDPSLAEQVRQRCSEAGLPRTHPYGRRRRSWRAP